MSLTKYATSGEARVAKKLVRELISRGLYISVFDGAETTIQNSQNEKEILSALATTDHDILRARAASGGSYAAWFLLVYGNADTGEELIADHSANTLSDSVYAAVYPD